MDAIYQRFIEIADRKKQVYDEDLEMIMLEMNARVPETWTLVSLQTTSGGQTTPTATVKLQMGENVREDVALGNGPVDAVYKAINRLVNVPNRLIEFSIQAVTGGIDAIGEVTIRIESEGRVYTGHGANTDIIFASSHAYINALNKLLTARQAQQTGK